MRSPLFVHLRKAAAQAHAALEDAFDLETVMSGPQQARRVLERFYGFHVVWEAALARSDLAGFAAARSRLPHLRADLEALGGLAPGDLAQGGLAEHDLAALPRCEAAARLPATRAGGVGSLYVMEGSTLGGQVISRALAAADWTPAAGLTYFNPYGPDTGPQWRAFMDWASEAAANDDPQAVADRANETFALLQAWLTEGIEGAP